jgi:hypothetical protein
VADRCNESFAMIPSAHFVGGKQLNFRVIAGGILVVHQRRGIKRLRGNFAEKCSENGCKSPWERFRCDNAPLLPVQKFLKKVKKRLVSLWNLL